METIYFGGIQAKVLALSPHNSYFLFRLSNRIAVRGIYTADFVWDSVTDNLKGFLPQRFTLYVGTNSSQEAEEFIKGKLLDAGGIVYQDIRVSQHVVGYPYEVKAIELSSETIIQAVQDFPV